MIRSLPNCRHFKAHWSPTPPSGSTSHSFSLLSSPTPPHYCRPPWSISFNCTPATLNTGLLTSHSFMPGHRHYVTQNFQGLPTGPAQPSSLFALLFPKRHFHWLRPVHSSVLRRDLFFPSSFHSFLLIQGQPLILSACHKDSSLPHLLQSRGPSLFWVSQVLSSAWLMLPHIPILSVSPPAHSI